MLSRLFWVGIAGLALVTGMVLQDGGRMLAWGHDSGVSRDVERTIGESIERSVSGGLEQVRVIDSDGQEIDVPPATRRAFADAVGRLVKAEADLAVMKVRDGSDDELRAASAARDSARAEVESLKAAMRGETQTAIRQTVRDQVRTTVRETVRN